MNNRITHYERKIAGTWKLCAFKAIQSRSYPSMSWNDGYYDEDAHTLISSWNISNSHVKYRMLSTEQFEDILVKGYSSWLEYYYISDHSLTII